MQNLLAFVIVGFGAQLVDGALGMAFGVTASTLLLGNGLTPALASASVHLAELGTSLASGAAHWRFRNVDWRLVGRLGVPGAVGAFLGATILSSISTEVAVPGPRRFSCCSGHTSWCASPCALPGCGWRTPPRTGGGSSPRSG